MGIGKTTACQILKRKLPNSVFLDGDWCWDMHPFQVTQETKTMVLNNICFLLNNFLRCSAYENILFCWVMHQQEIIDVLLSRLDTAGCTVKSISLVCSPNALEARLLGDIQQGVRTQDVLQRSLARLPLYDSLNTIKIDVSRMTPQQVAEAIQQL